ncbi:flagellar basal body rod protein FlgF [Pseudidiomarina gelatinasegens]|jgi:flagellar basal-body rod protein FlgF|uniref:Flagellar basal-body rod protein FlgF n=1 Tax=Pseudidiomarina gelatinasegens TaxID=2487740 RepID=A0A443YZH2_9GAMM|nr:flagellar basal body rod protein FlgF [Pseudidiomarina gelatinasegens]RWU09619.1 flagellar basal body rod protein FlgF [Pseudidiomarina gelatinasegens]|tara:strand:+ start:889 stop:1632 length:744 start_codon:yes stop_codon:yes gene_type:complete
MDAILYTAMNGARQTLDEQSVVTNNLSNASTTGFRAQLAAARAVPVNGPGVHATRVAAVTTTGLFDTTGGAIQTTERDLDVALDQNNWLAVQTPAGEAYTKRGDLQLDADGRLMVNGMPVLGDGGPILLPLGTQVSIGNDGTVSGIGMGGDANELVPLDRIKMVRVDQPNQLQRGDDGWFRSPVGAALARDENAQLVSGALEGSNVNTIEAMVAMIDTQRRYDLNMSVISKADETAQSANSLLSVRG